ncbi:MAG TPA: Ig-like domain-containing protein, partial [Candidatus Saccharimonadales bacterium]|nr:Ig-like domain-containing protein [Candidatus Saccharimonadales bacterium]
MKTKIIVIIIGAVIALTGVGVWLAFKGASPSAPAPTKTSSVAGPVIALNIPDESLRLGADDHSLEVGITGDLSGIVRVEYLIDDVVSASVIDPPFTATIDVSHLEPGEHRLRAQAYDGDGNIGKSEVFTFTIKESGEAEPANDESEQIVAGSQPFGSAPSGATVSTSGSHGTGSSTGGNNNGSGNGGDNDGGGDDDNPPVDTTPWPDAPPVSICTTQPWN